MKKSFFILLILFTISCRKDFHYNFENNPQVNVSCFIHAKDTVKLQLTYLLGDISVGTILADKDYITNAEIFLYEDMTFKEQLQYKEIPTNISVDKGWYFSRSFIPKENHSYQLKIVVPGFDTVYAETFIPQAVKIDSVQINGKRVADTVYLAQNTDYSVNTFFKDKAGQKDYYNYWSNTFFKSYDPAIESKYRSGYYESSTLAIYKFAFFSDNLFNGKSYALNTNFNSYIGDISGEGYPIIFKLYSLSYDAYAFYKTFYLYQKTLENPLSEPVIIYSNIKNGTGIFAGMSSDVDSVLIMYKQSNDKVSPFFGEYD
jgi:hypothetical protein